MTAAPGDAPPPAAPVGAWRRHPAVRAAGYAIGLTLLAAALALVWRQRDTIGAALRAADGTAPEMAALLLAAVVVNLAVTASLFHVLMRRFGAVGRLEMQAVIAAAALMNFLPLRPGLFGRLAYHRAVNGIAVRDATRVVFEAVALSVACAVWLALSVGAARATAVPLWIAALLPVPVLALAFVVPGPWRGGTWPTAGLLRYADALVWAVRYWAAFRLLGIPIGVDAALAFAAVSTITSMIPLVSGGLGLREWAIGFCAPLLTAHSLEMGVTADLVNRAAELVIGALGTAGMAYVARRMRAAGRNPAAPGAEGAA